MEREQIIKALELHANAEKSCVDECPYGNMRRCGSAMATDALSLIKELTEENERLRAEGKWISVADGLPEPYTTVLVYGMGSIASDYLTSRGVWYNHEIITHWKHLPESPKMKGE